MKITLQQTEVLKLVLQAMIERDKYWQDKLLVLKKEIMDKLKEFEEVEVMHRYDVEKIIEGVF